MCICSGLSPRLNAMEGRAVLTMVVSSDCIKKPNATIQSCQRTLAGSSVIVIQLPIVGVDAKNADADDRRTDKPPGWYRGLTAGSSPDPLQW